MPPVALGLLAVLGAIVCFQALACCAARDRRAVEAGLWVGLAWVNVLLSWELLLRWGGR